MYTINRIASIVDASSVLANKEAAIEYLITDSRKVTFAASSLFFTLKTEHRNALVFLDDLYQQGVRNFVVQEEIDFSKYKDANFLVVKNSLKALQKLAQFHRLQFHYPVMGITGSNGKTIVKEWLNFLLSDSYKIVRSPRSYNSQIGVPLSIWQMNAENDLGIFEAGISERNEMDALRKIIQPTIGILTNIGDAHDKGFESRKQKLQEKLRLFQHSKIVFANADDENIKASIAEVLNTDIFSFGKNRNATLHITAVKKEQNKTVIEGVFENNTLYITIPFLDEASVQNALICWAVALYFKVSESVIMEKMAQLPAIDMRLQVLPAINGCTVINDSYSLDIDSLSVGLDLLNQQLLSKTVILSDVHEAEERTYIQILDILHHKKISRLIAIGKFWESLKPFMGSKIPIIETYNSTFDFVQQFHAGQFKNESILLKGARLFRFEDILNLLVEKVHQTRLEINLSNIVHNFKTYKKRLQPSTKMMAMVKAFAYGSGSVEIASILQYHKIDYLAVAYADEGVELRNAGINLPIMVMNVDEYGFEAMLQHNLEPEIYSFKILKEFTVFVQKQAVAQYPVHLKLDTGMHRLGFEEGEIDRLMDELKVNKSLVIKSVFSHLSSSEDAADDNFTKLQAEIFQRCCDKIQNVVQYNFIRHLANSAGIARHPDLQFDMVRLGIGLYGVDTTDKGLALKNVATLKSTIAQIKHLQPNETVGYNRMGKISQPTTTATIRIGYADGYSRKLSNGVGFVLINNHQAPVIGNVCMDMTMVDITHIDNVNEGDEVEVFGVDLPVENIAKWSDTNVYEIFTSVGQRVKRVYVEE